MGSGNSKPEITEEGRVKESVYKGDYDVDYDEGEGDEYVEREVEVTENNPNNNENTQNSPQRNPQQQRQQQRMNQGNQGQYRQGQGQYEDGDDEEEGDFIVERNPPQRGNQNQRRNMEEAKYQNRRTNQYQEQEEDGYNDEDNEDNYQENNRYGAANKSQGRTQQAVPQYREAPVRSTNQGGLNRGTTTVGGNGNQMNRGNTVARTNNMNMGGEQYSREERGYQQQVQGDFMPGAAVHGKGKKKKKKKKKANNINQQQDPRMMQNNMQRGPVTEIGRGEIPKFSQYVQEINSDIPYPVKILDMKVPTPIGPYFFTPNTNFFDVLDEDKLILLPASDLKKMYECFIQGQKSAWSDREFPPRLDSLCKDMRKQGLFKDLIWKRASESTTKGEPMTLFEIEEKNAIQPGSLYNLAFQSVVYILSHPENALSSNIPVPNEDSKTVFAIWLNDGGEWKPFIIDDYIPFDKNKNDWAFCSTKPKGELWILLLEKAMAKMYGSYEKLLRGHPAHFMHDLTGAPYDHYYFDDEENCWEFLSSVNPETSVVVAMNKDPSYLIETESQVDKKPAYSYEILRKLELTTLEGVIRLIQLRSPFEQDVWTGDWSRNSRKWTPDLMKKLNPNGYSKNEFWIDLGNFVKYYGVGYMFTLFDEHKHASLKLRHTNQKSFSLVLVHVPGEGGHGFLKVSQRDVRHFEKEGAANGKYEYSTVRMMMARVDIDMRLEHFVEGISDKGRDCEMEVELEPGDYLVCIELDWVGNWTREFVFNSYHQVNLVFYELETKEDQFTIVNRFLKSYFLSSPEAAPAKTYSGYGGDQIRMSSEYVYGYLAFYYLNLSEHMILEEKVTMKGLKGLQICPPFKNPEEYSVKVGPRQDALVLYKTVAAGTSRYFYKPEIRSMLYPEGDRKTLKEFIMRNATKVTKKRFSRKGEIEVFVYVYNFNGGIYLYYVNQTQLLFHEMLTVELDNLVNMDNAAQTEFQIKLGPGEDFILRFKVIDPSRPYSYHPKMKFKLRDSMQRAVNKVKAANAFSQASKFKDGTSQINQQAMMNREGVAQANYGNNNNNNRAAINNYVGNPNLQGNNQGYNNMNNNQMPNSRMPMPKVNNSLANNSMINNFNNQISQLANIQPQDMNNNQYNGVRGSQHYNQEEQKQGYYYPQGYNPQNNDYQDEYDDEEDDQYYQQGQGQQYQQNNYKNPTQNNPSYGQQQANYNQQGNYNQPQDTWVNESYSHRGSATARQNGVYPVQQQQQQQQGRVMNNSKV